MWQDAEPGENGRNSDEPENAIAASEDAMRLSLVRLESEFAEPGQAAFEIHATRPGGTTVRIAQNTLPDAEAHALGRLLVEGPARLVLIARYGAPGITGNLFAALTPETLRSMGVEIPSAGDEEPWRASLEHDEWTAQENRAEGTGLALVPFPLGAIVRTASRIQFPGDLAAEADDILAQVLMGCAVPQIDHILEDLTGGPSQLPRRGRPR